MSFTVDTSDLKRVATNLGKVAGSLIPDVDAVVKKGANNIKEELAADARGSTHFKGMAGSISYDSKYGIGEVAYEIGPDKGRAGGALGNIYYFGTSRGGGSGNLEGPLNNEAPRLEKALGDILGEIGDRI